MDLALPVTLMERSQFKFLLSVEACPIFCAFFYGVPHIAGNTGQATRVDRWPPLLAVCFLSKQSTFIWKILNHIAGEQEAGYDGTLPYRATERVRGTTCESFSQILYSALLWTDWPALHFRLSTDHPAIP